MNADTVKFETASVAGFEALQRDIVWDWKRKTLVCGYLHDFGTDELWVTKHANDEAMRMSRKKN